MSLYPQIKQFLLGKTLPTSAHSEERLSNAAALAVLSSDALSSVAYATGFKNGHKVGVLAL